MTKTTHTDSSVSSEEVALFNSLASQWWDTRGPMRVLHQMNPLRIAWTCQFFRTHHVDRQHAKILDIGCGAGIATEALALHGYQVEGIDVSAETLDAAREHADLSAQGNPKLRLTYRNVSAEQLLEQGETFDAITAFELIEHTNDPLDYMYFLAGLLKPGAPLILSTMNRTPASFLIAKLGAEYVLNLLPRGTHQFNKFIKPTELAHYGRQAGLRLDDESGMTYLPTGWKLTQNMSINYLMGFVKL